MTLIKVCGGKIYRYKNYLFEDNPFHGISPLKKNYEPSKKTLKGFWDAIKEFQSLSKDAKEGYRVY